MNKFWTASAWPHFYPPGIFGGVTDVSIICIFQSQFCFDRLLWERPYNLLGEGVTGTKNSRNLEFLTKKLMLTFYWSISNWVLNRKCTMLSLHFNCKSGSGWLWLLLWPWLNSVAVRRGHFLNLNQNQKSKLQNKKPKQQNKRNKNPSPWHNSVPADSDTSQIKIKINQLNQK